VCSNTIAVEASRGAGKRWTRRPRKRRWAGKKTGNNPTDRGKLGVKRSVLTDARGVVLGLAVGPANRHDIRLAMPTLDSLLIHRPQPAIHRPQHLCADKAYDAADFRRRLERRHYTWHIKSRGDEARDKRRHSRNKPRRWVNERTQSWFHRFHRVMIRWEKKVENYFNELMFVAAWIAYRAAGVLG
jgi:transposase